mmetsp:Transcript_42136/g.100731  ORF Transcript_42136/g.100731 Transcript_42136/m.100731 type:complete len:205 (-) Transcript_42136:522-1136(-)
MHESNAGLALCPPLHLLLALQLAGRAEVAEAAAHAVLAAPRRVRVRAGPARAQVVLRGAGRGAQRRAQGVGLVQHLRELQDRPTLLDRCRWQHRRLGRCIQPRSHDRQGRCGRQDWRVERWGRDAARHGGGDVQRSKRHFAGPSRGIQAVSILDAADGAGVQKSFLKESIERKWAPNVRMQKSVLHEQRHRVLKVGKPRGTQWA